MKLKNLVFILAAAILAAGCSSQPKTTSSVTNFFRQDIENINGRTFVIETSEADKNNLEFLTYAADITRALTVNGLIEANNRENAELTVRFTYNTNSFETHIRRCEVTTFERERDIRLQQQTTTHDKRARSRTEDRVERCRYLPETKFRHTLTVNIEDIAKSAQAGGRYNVFQGSVSTDSLSSTINPVFNCLVFSLFRDFPGVSGQTVIHTQNPKTCRI